MVTNEKANFGERLKLALEKTNTKQIDLYQPLGITRQTLHRIITGEANGAGYAFEIASILKINPIWLAYGTGQMFEPDDPIIAFLMNYRKIPLLNKYESIQEWLVESDKISQDLTQYQYILSDKNLHAKNSFAYKIQDKSMIPTFPPGTIIIIKFNEKPKHGDIVIAYITRLDELVIREYRNENNTNVLVSFNPTFFNSITLDDTDKLIGTASEIRLFISN